MTETVHVTDRTPISIWTKLNPLWWLVGPDGWSVPDINNGEPYLPDVKNIWLRRFYWFICRNPLMNFVGFVLGIEDKNYTAFGSAPVMAATGRDCSPQQFGWRWAVCRADPSGYAAILVLFCVTLLMLHIWSAAIVMCFAIFKSFGVFPYVNYWNGRLEFYTGWRPHSGGFGSKIVLRSNG